MTDATRRIGRPPVEPSLRFWPKVLKTDDCLLRHCTDTHGVMCWGCGHWGYRSIDTDWDAQCGVAWEEMQVVPDDGDPRSIGERLDALAELEARSAA